MFKQPVIQTPYFLCEQISFQLLASLLLNMIPHLSLKKPQENSNKVPRQLHSAHLFNKNYPVIRQWDK